MTELTQSEVPGASSDADLRMSALRTAGAERFDPVRWHFIETLARRASAYQQSTRRLLDARLSQALAAFDERFTQAKRDAEASVAQGVQRYPHAEADLQRLCNAGDFKALHRFLATLDARAQCASLGALVRELEQHAPEHAEARVEAQPGSRAELKAIRQFRKTWAKLSVDKQVAQALEQAPKNAGPINSHMLVLRSLALMREISPDYLNRFISYADTLLALDQGEKDMLPAAKKAPVAKTAKKKSTRG